MNIGNTIKLLRMDKNISQKDLAKKLDMPASTLANYEKNFREPKLETLKKISGFFNMNLSEFLALVDSLDKLNNSEQDEFTISKTANKKEAKLNAQILTLQKKIQEQENKFQEKENKIEEQKRIIKEQEKQLKTIQDILGSKLN